MLIVFITQGRGRVAPKREDGMGSSAADRGVASLTGKLNDLHIASRWYLHLYVTSTNSKDSVSLTCECLLCAWHRTRRVAL